MLLQMALFFTFSWLCLYIYKHTHIYIYHNFFIYSSVNGHLDCFHLLAIVNTAAMHMEVHVSF